MFAIVIHQNGLAIQHDDKFVIVRVPVALRGPGSGLQLDIGCAEIRQLARWR
jgi:hypothetical protein